MHQTKPFAQGALVDQTGNLGPNNPGNLGPNNPGKQMPIFVLRIHWIYCVVVVAIAFIRCTPMHRMHDHTNQKEHTESMTLTGEGPLCTESWTLTGEREGPLCTESWTLTGEGPLF